MKRFDYNNAYLNMKHGEESLANEKSEQSAPKPVKPASVRETVEVSSAVSNTPEQQAIDKANAEKAKVQDDVNGVLYQDSRPKKSVIRINKPNNQESGSSSVSESEPEVESVYSEDEDDDVSTDNGYENMSDNFVGDSYSSDAVVDDFKDNFDKSDSDDDAVLVRPGDVVSRPKERVAPVEQPSVRQSRPVNENQFESSAQLSQSSVRPVQSSVPKYAPSNSSTATIVDRNSISVGQPKIYAELAERVQSMFPAAAGSADAINAYLYIKLGYPSDVAISKQLKEVIDSYVGDGTDDYYIESDMNELLEKVLTLQSNDKAVMHKLELLEVLIAYLLCEYNAYIVVDRGGNHPKGPGDLKLCNSQVQSLINNLESIGASDLANWKIGKTSRTSASGRRMT